MKKGILYGLAGLIIGVFITIFLAQAAVSSNNVGMMQMMGIGIGSNNNQGYMGNIDRHFIEQMVPHHEDAITMAEVALEKARRPEIKSLAQDIIKAQKAEIEQMKNWYKSWFGTDVSETGQVMGMHGMRARGGMHMGMMGDETDLESFREAEDFDKAFMEEMIPHHQMAVMMAQMLKNTTQRSEMKQLAENIIDAQNKEINQMRGWYRNIFIIP